MLTSKRKSLILELVQTEGQVVVQELSQRWNVSEDSIRRDLRDLSGQGLLQRVHGGAISSSPATADYSKREELSTEVKVKLGRAACALIQEHQVIGLDGGTTTLQLVRQLPKNLKITVITHSPIIAAELRMHHLIEVILLGGRLFKHSMVTLGADTLNALAKLHVDIFFLGATGIHLENGVTTGDWDEAAIKRAFCARAGEVVLMASPEKIQAASSYVIVPAWQIGTLIVDHKTSKSTIKKFEKAGMTVVLAG